MADIINKLGLGNTLSAVMLTYPTLLIPFCAWLLMGYFKSVPRELEEAARIDGASRFQAMLRVVLPLCTPGLLSAGIFAFTLAQNEFLYALIFLTTSEVRTVPVGAITELIRATRPPRCPWPLTRNLGRRDGQRCGVPIPQARRDRRAAAVGVYQAASVSMSAARTAPWRDMLASRSSKMRS